MTMGIEDVAALAGCTDVEARATIGSPLNRTKSAASSGSPPELDQSVPALDPAKLPQAYREACHSRASAGSEALSVKIPTRYTFPDRCASAARGDARTTAPVPARNARRSITG